MSRALFHVEVLTKIMQHITLTQFSDPFRLNQVSVYLCGINVQQQKMFQSY